LGEQHFGVNEQTRALAHFPSVLDGGADRRLYRWCKRLMDVLLSLTLVVLLAPVLLLVALLIKLDSRGPVLFVQQRVGCRPAVRERRVFYIVRNFRFYKFRSMRPDVDDRLHQACVREFVNGRSEWFADSPTKFKLRSDPRVTRVGRILRKTSLDELPQLLNVIKGEMSLVGPRPVPPYEVAHYDQRQFGRLMALPGITGSWQVKGRCQLSFRDMIRMDLDYVRDASLWLDLKLLFRTIPAVISGRGAE